VKLVNFLDSNGVTVLTAKTLAQVTAGTAGAGVKLGFQNVGDEALAGLELQLEQVGSGDGYSMAEWVFDTATLSPPWGVTATLQTNIGTTQWGAGNAGRKYFVITAVNATGETAQSVEVFADVVNVGASLGDRVLLAWTAVPGATSYRIYRSTTSGSYATPKLVATVADPGVSYTDDGSAVTSGAPPADNTSGGTGPAYGTPPTGYQETPLVVGGLPVGKAVFYWVRADVPLGTSSTGNPRSVKFVPVEV